MGKGVGGRARKRRDRGVVVGVRRPTFERVADVLCLAGKRSGTVRRVRSRRRRVSRGSRPRSRLVFYGRSSIRSFVKRITFVRVTKYARVAKTAKADLSGTGHV